MEEQDQKIYETKHEINQVYDELDEISKQSRELEDSWHVLSTLNRTRNTVSDLLSRGWTGEQGVRVSVELEDTWNQERQNFNQAFDDIEERLATEKSKLNESLLTAEQRLKKLYNDEVTAQ